MPVLLPSTVQGLIGYSFRVPSTEPQLIGGSLGGCHATFYFPPEESFNDPCSHECALPGYPGLTLHYWITIGPTSSGMLRLTISVLLAQGKGFSDVFAITSSHVDSIINPPPTVDVLNNWVNNPGFAFDQSSLWLRNNPFGQDPTHCGVPAISPLGHIIGDNLQDFLKYFATERSEDFETTWETTPKINFSTCGDCEGSAPVLCENGQDQFSYETIIVIGTSDPITLSFSGSYSPPYDMNCSETSEYLPNVAEYLISELYSTSISESLSMDGASLSGQPSSSQTVATSSETLIVTFKDNYLKVIVDPETGDDINLSEYDIDITSQISLICNCSKQGSDPPFDPDNPWGDPDQPCAGEPQWKVYCPSGMHFYGHFEAMIRKKDDPEETYRWRLTSSPREITLAGGCLGVPFGLLHEDYAWIRGPGTSGESGYKAGLHLSATTDLVNWSPPSKAFQDPIWWGIYYYILTEARLVGTLDPEWEWVGTPYGTFQPGYLHGITTIKYLDCNNSVVGWDINPEDVSNPTSDQPVPPPEAPPPPGIPCKQYVVLAKISMGIGSHLKKKFLEEVEDAIRARARRAGKLIGQSRSPIDQQIWDAFELIVDRVVDALSLSVTLASYQIPLICTWYEASELELFLLNQLIDILVSWPSATITAPLSIKLSAEVEVLPEECECQPP